MRIESECACSRQPMTLEIDNHLRIKVKEEGCRPVIFVPEVDFFNLDDDSIINAF